MCISGCLLVRLTLIGTNGNIRYQVRVRSREFNPFSVWKLWHLHSPFLCFSGKKRKPAWTDRILWRIKPKTQPSEDDDEKASTSTDDGLDEYPLLVTQDKYACDMSYGVSDHKPVIATFNLEVRADSL